MDTTTADPTAIDGHHYSTVSTHSTSEGRLAYQRCTCGTWRMQRFPRFGAPVVEASVPGRKYRVEPVVDAPVERASGGHLAMSAHVVGG